jgi:hypothetical protein
MHVVRAIGVEGVVCFHPQLPPPSSCGQPFETSQLEIEPGVSLAEYADSYHNPTPEAELHLFRKIDNIPSNNLLALAKGETSIVDIKNSSHKEPTLIKSGPKSGFDIHQWRMHYGYALKAYLLYHEKLKPLDYIKKYIFWMWKDYAIGSLSIPFIGALLSQNFSGIIKGINSASTEKVIKGIKNAAWDMTLAHYWTNFVIHRKPQGPCLILCTQDKALKYITDGLTYLEEKPPINQLFEKIFQGLLKKPEIDKLVLFYEKLDNRRNASCRKVHSYKKDQNFFNTYISELEVAALNNVKNRQGSS